MVLPVAIAILFFTVLLVRESGEFESVLEYVIIILIFGVFYLLVVPIVSIWFTGRALIKNTESDDRDMDMVKVLKLFEHIGEALPQLILSCIFIASNGGPWVSIIFHSSEKSPLYLDAGLIKMQNTTTGAWPQHNFGLLLSHEPSLRPRHLRGGLHQEQGGQGGGEVQTDSRDALQLDLFPMRIRVYHTELKQDTDL